MVSGYGEEYFAWQRSVGSFGALRDADRYGAYVAPTMTVLDFGCGGGYLLARLQAARRIGVDVNPHALAEAARQPGIETHRSLEEIPSATVDVAIASSSLEHTERPLDQLREIHRTLKSGGRLLCSVPHEGWRWRYAPNDINQHLYTWSPMSLGNLVTSAGFEVQSIRALRETWPPLALCAPLRRFLGARGFGVACRAWHLVRIALSPIKPFPIRAELILVAVKRT